MPSAIRFFRSQQNNEKKEYKTAKFRDLENAEFKYYELPRTDIMRKEELRIHIDNTIKTICTSEELNSKTFEELKFNNDMVIIINGFEYIVKFIYIELDPDDNNFFNIKPRQRTYLMLGRDS